MKKHHPRAQECLRLCPSPAAPLDFDLKADMACLHDWAAREVMQGHISGSEIQASCWAGVHREVRPAFVRLHDLLKSLLPPTLASLLLQQPLLIPELLYCRWAAPHTDNPFENELFLSLVLGTGSSPYRVESLVPTIAQRQDGRRVPRLGFERQALTLKAGMVFLLDPLVPHYACPETPHQDSLLSLLQLRLPYRDRRERHQWIRSLAPSRLQPATHQEI